MNSFEWCAERLLKALLKFSNNDYYELSCMGARSSIPSRPQNCEETDWVLQFCGRGGYRTAGTPNKSFIIISTDLP